MGKERFNSPADVNRERAVGERSCCHAAEQHPADDAASVRGHHDRVASVAVGGLDDAIGGQPVLRMHLVPRTPNFSAASVHSESSLLAHATALFS